eukprot:TRINITY_DN3694_c0_g1_i5.p1 TRINITY_DN3694_c0_g1~~TRINITY_DN3694_c0_g1_i5.p1  ORF type:complete len:256 (+),score=29.63 TRINITY_DN3694_c0_g1_i5:80-847(+)
METESSCHEIQNSLFSISDLRDNPNGNDEILLEVYRELLQVHFPVEGELDKLEDLMEGLKKPANNRDPEMHILVAKCKKSSIKSISYELAGCCGYEYYPTGNLCIMMYLCVAKPFRRQGLAGKFVRTMEAQLLQRSKGQPIAAILAETHTAAVDDEIMDPLARQEVLSSLGFRCLDFNYIQPPVSDEHEPCGGLRLLVKDQKQLPSQVIIDYLDGFSGSVNDWQEDRWKGEPWYTGQISELQKGSIINALEQRPW